MQLFRILILLCTLLCAGCSGIEKTVPSAEYTVQDVRGKVVSLVKAPQKVLTDSLHLDETLLCIVPADHLAGAYYLDEEPGISFIAAETKTVQPKLRQVTPETVASLHPDVFLAFQWSDPGLIQKVEEMGIPVVVCYGPVTLQQIQENVKLIGKTMGKEKKGDAIVQQMQSQLEKIDHVLKQQSSSKPVGLLVSLMSRYGGKGSLYDTLAQKAGFINGIAAAGLRNGDALTPEAVLKANPDFFLLSQPYGEEKNQYDPFMQQFLNNPALVSLQGRRQVALPDRYVYDASPMVVYGIEAMANAAYEKVLFPKREETILRGQ